MRRFISEYFLCALTLIGGIIFLGVFINILTNPLLKSDVIFPYKREDVGVSVDYNVPLIKEEDFIINNKIVEYGSEFNYRDYVSAKTTNGVDISSYITMDGQIDTKKTGMYNLKFCLKWNGNTIIKQSTFYVKNSDARYMIYGDTYKNIEVSLYKGTDLISNVKSDDNGRFEIKNIFNGEYELVVKELKKKVVIDNNDIYVGYIK